MPYRRRRIRRRVRVYKRRVAVRRRRLSRVPRNRLSTFTSGVHRYMREAVIRNWTFQSGQILLNNPYSGSLAGIPPDVSNICALYDYVKIHKVVVVFRPCYNVACTVPNQQSTAWWLPPIYYREDKDSNVPPANADPVIRDPKHKVITQAYGRAIKISVTPGWQIAMAGTPSGGTAYTAGIEPSNKRWINAQNAIQLTLFGGVFWTDPVQPGTTPMTYTVSQRWYFECKAPINPPL